MLSVADVSRAMRTVLTTTADAAGRQSGCITRVRKFTGSTLCQTLIFGWLANPQATLSQLCQVAATLGVEITEQSLDERFTREAAAMLKEVLAAAVEQVLATSSVRIPLLQRFGGRLSPGLYSDHLAARACHPLAWLWGCLRDRAYGGDQTGTAAGSAPRAAARAGPGRREEPRSHRGGAPPHASTGESAAGRSRLLQPAHACRTWRPPPHPHPGRDPALRPGGEALVACGLPAGPRRTG